MTDSSNDCLTAAEALKRLGEQAPSRSAFYQAIRDGKVAKVPAAGSAGKALVSWASVQAWHRALPPSGARKRKQQPNSAASPQVSGSVGSPDATDPHAPKPPTGNPSDRQASSHPEASGRAIPRDGRSPGKDGERKPQTQRPALANRDVVGRIKGRPIRLRKLKDILRPLDLEQSFELRAWLEN